MKHLRVMGPGLPSAVLLVCGLAGAARAQLVAVDDTFGVPYGTSLIQEAPGVLANDTYNSDPAEGVATAGLLTYPDYGTLTCESNPALDLCPDGSFTYTPDASFPGFDSFTYEATVASETSQATVTLTACNGGPTVFTCWKEVPYLAKLGELGYRNFQEGFEGDGAWGSVREPDTAPSVSSQGISWTTNHPATNEITTGTGVERTGLWGVYDPAHGYATGSAGECDVDNPPPQCLYKDGFTGTRQPSQSTLYGVGGHFTGSLDPKLVMILDAGAPIGLGLVPVGDPTFFGVIDTTGFTTFRVEETDGKVGQIRLVFGDDFTFATTPADGTPPQVSKVDSVASTGGGELSEGEVTTAAITQLLVTYDELVSEVGAEVGTDSVTNLANYLLFSDGGDGFDTVDCATGVDAGDVAVAVDWVTYTSGSERTATLDLNGGTALPSASYRLLACGTTSIRDWAGNALDGNGNGTGGDDFQRNFTVSTAVECVVDADCDNGLFCDGAENCVASVCVAGTPPNCNDGVGCTVDSCSEGTDSCHHTPNDALCDNGLFCDGAETCNLASDCQPGTPPNCNDGVGCTVDSCNEGTDSCNHAPNDALCDNGLFCDGAETCNLVSDCQPGSDPCPQGEVCNEVDDICEPGINHEPVAVDDAYATDQGVELDVTAPGVLDNDSDPDGDAITAVKVTDPADGSLILNADGSFTYTPDPGFFGVDSFTYKANDTLLDSNIATVTLTVNEGDTTPPQVALLDSVASTDDHMLLEGEAALVPITQLLVSFDEPVADPPGDGGPDDVTNPSNYLLVAAGVDGNLQTLTCGGPSGDDQPITVAAVDYDDATQTAALHLDGGVSLPVADYRLLVCGSTSIVDLAGNPLDGNGDGTGGDDFALTFSVVRTNELLNPNFDSNLSPWITDSPLPNEIAWEAKDIDDAPTSGSLGIWNLTGAGAFYSLSQCVVLGDANAYDLGGMVWLLSSTAGHPTALGRVDVFAAVDCSGAPLSGTPTDPVQGDTATLWLALETRVAAPPGANSALVTFAIDAGLSPDFDAGFDRLFFAGSDAVFLDGFESGDTSAWSRQVP
jgi:hypothetical protein